MKSLLTALSILTIGATTGNLSSSLNINANTNKNLNIINGNKVSIGEFPWYGGQSYKGLSPTICNGGGVLIAPQWVLTARHVAFPNPPKTPETFNFGIYNKKHPYKLETRTGINEFSPEPYGTINPYHDIALVKLDKAITDIKPIKFANLTQKAKPGQEVTVCGYGDDIRGLPTDDFMKATVKIQDPSLAKDPKYHLTDYEPFDSKYDFITGTLTGPPKGASLGDSGGPLLQLINNEWIVQGVASRGPGLDKKSGVCLSIYAGVSEWNNWIKNIMKNN